MHDKLKKLCEPYQADQITTRNENGRTESWVEQHHLLDRLNECEIPYSWQIITSEATPVKIGRNQKDGQHAYIHGRLTLHLGDTWMTRDGMGEATMLGYADARKGANSVAFRHAMKFATTFLWRGALPQEEAESGQRVEADTPPPPAPAAANPDGTENHAASAPEGMPEWAQKLPADWNNLMGRIAEATTLDRASFEGAVFDHISRNEYQGKIYFASSYHKTFKDWAFGTSSKGKPLYKVAFHAYKNDGLDIAARLESGQSVKLNVITDQGEAACTIPSRTDKSEPQGQVDEFADGPF